MFKVKKIKFNFSKIITFILLCVLLFVGILTLPFANKIYPNIYISNVYIGDKSKEEALKIIKEIKLQDKILLSINNQTKEILTSEIVKGVNYDKSIDRAYNLANSGNFLFDILTKLKLIIKPINLGLDIDTDDTKLTETLLIISSKEGNLPIKPTVKIVGSQIIVDPGKNGIKIDIEEAKGKIIHSLVNNSKDTVTIELLESKEKLDSRETEELKARAQKLLDKNIELVLDFDKVTLNDKDLISFLSPRGGFDEEKIKESIIEISRKVNRNPQDSVFIVENGNVTEFTPSKDGVTVNEKELISEIKDYLSKLSEEKTKFYSFEIPVVKSPAKIKTGDINNLGIESLLGKGVSHFKGSIPNRIHNVNLAQSKFKGILVPPGEVFSFNSILGDVSSYTGYKAAYVIKDGKTVLGDGGGVCQVSTTLFRAILSAGLPIIERKPHSYRVGYYEQGFGPGLDATVFYPTTDLKFKNDTPAYLLIQPTIDNPNYTLTFEIYGTSDGRISSVSKPIITSSSAPAADLYVDDPILPQGTIKQIEHRAYGARVVFDYNVTRNGEVLIDQKFVSNYRPWQAVYLRGVGTF